MKRSGTMTKTTDALKILDQMIDDDADMRQMIAEETLHAHVARMIYEARAHARKTRKSKHRTYTDGRAGKINPSPFAPSYPASP